jgi:hypothetical protein
VNVQITHVIVHTPEQVRGIVVEALAIADEHASDTVRWEAVFAQACQLLGQRFTMAMGPQPVQMPAMAIPGLKRN